MKKFIAAIVLMVALLSGCGSEPTPEQAYLENVRANSATFEGIPDADVLETGYLVCANLSQGITVGEMYIGAVDAGLNTEMLAVAIGAAVKDLCPEHQPAIDGYLDNTL